MLNKNVGAMANRSYGHGKIIILSGPSGSGKTTLHKTLLESKKLKGKLVKSISATTRPKREGEKNGRDYLFLDEATFARRIAKGYFLEWEKVFANFYGTPKIQVQNLLKKGKSVLLCIDVKGAAQIAQEFPEAVKIFIKPPSMAVLRKRLKMRASETKETLGLRLKVAKAELKAAKNYDYIIINGNLDEANRALEKLTVNIISKVK